MARVKGNTQRSAKPTGPYHSFLAATRAAGATEFCRRACYGWVLPGQDACPDWDALGLPKYTAPAAVLVLDGRLEGQDTDEAEPYDDTEPVAEPEPVEVG